MTLWMLLFYVLLGAVMAWPCWLLLNRVLRARQPLICVQPYRPSLPPAKASDSAVPEVVTVPEVLIEVLTEALPETVTVAATETTAVAVANDAQHAEPPARASDAPVRPTTRCSHRIRSQTVRMRAMRPCRRLSHP